MEETPTGTLIPVHLIMLLETWRNLRSGRGMSIQHIGQSVVRASRRNLTLKDILHVPQAAKNLVSVNRLAKDNNVFFEFHPEFFCIKDRDTKSTIHKGAC